jgi:disulfide bond formation protein DsbB
MEWRVPWPWVGLLAALAALAQQAIALLHGGAPSFLSSMWQVGVMAVGMASLSLILLPPRRLSFALGFLVCAALMGWALWLQFGEGLEPCPLCQFQRVAVVLFVFAAAGAALATRQVWLQALPKDQVPACGMGLSYMLDTLPFIDVLRRVLEGSGECAEKGWVFLGLSIAGWTLAFFFTIAVAGLALARRD